MMLFVFLGKTMETIDSLPVFSFFRSEQVVHKAAETNNLLNDKPKATTQLQRMYK